MILLEGRVNGLRWRVQVEEGAGDVRAVIEAARPVTDVTDAISTAEAVARWAQRCTMAWRNIFEPPVIGAGVPEGAAVPRPAFIEGARAP